MNASRKDKCRCRGAVPAGGPTDVADPATAASAAVELPCGQADRVSPAPGASRPQDARSERGRRIPWLDNLRTFMIFLVVLCHAGIVYESSGVGAYFWIVDDPATNDLSGLVNLVLDLFMMPTLFFLSGYLAPASLAGKTGWAYVRTRCGRLLIPWVLGVLTLIPLFKVMFLYSRNLPQEHWTAYFHFSNGIISQSWLWFLPVLFVFHVVYVLLARARIGVPGLSLKGAVPVAFLIGYAYSVAMDAFGLRGWTKIGVLDFQNERLLIYFLAFLLGALCFRVKAFDARRGSTTLYVVVNAVAWVPVTVYIWFVLFPWLNPGRWIVSEVSDRLILWFSYQLSLLGLVYVTVETFRRYQNRPGRLRSAWNANSYYVYVIHVVVMGGLALILLNTAIPSLLKYGLLTVSTFVICQIIVSLCRRGLNRLAERSGNLGARESSSYGRTVDSCPNVRLQ